MIKVTNFLKLHTETLNGASGAFFCVRLFTVADLLYIPPLIIPGGGPLIPGGPIGPPRPIGIPGGIPAHKLYLCYHPHTKHFKHTESNNKVTNQN